MTNSKRARRTIVSMSGFGSGTARNKLYAVTVEVRSLNSRFFDSTIRLPSSISGTHEAPIKELLEERLQRGRVEALVVVTAQATAGVRVRFDEKLFENSFRTIRRNKTVKRVLEDDEIAEVLLGRKEIFDLVRAEGGGKFDSKLLWRAMQAALKQLVSMRHREGLRLQEDLLGRIAELQSVATRLAGLANKHAPRARDELMAKLLTVSSKVKLDAQRIEQEVAMIVARADVHEELVRLKSHVGEFTRLLGEAVPGKRLEFLTQEFLRELNTIGSKVGLSEAQHAVVKGKGIVERIKEQVQNVA